MFKNSVTAQVLTSRSSATMTGSFVLLGTLSEAAFLLRITNDSDKNVIVSFDGINDQDIVLDGQTIEIYSQANAQPNNWVAQFPKGRKVFIKSAAGTGNIYLTTYYQEK